MHTFRHTTHDLGKVTIVHIHHNGDYSGNATIVCLDEGEIEVPCAALIDFAAEFVRSERVGALEQMSARQVLGLPEEDE